MSTSLVARAASRLIAAVFETESRQPVHLSERPLLGTRVTTDQRVFVSTRVTTQPFVSVGVVIEYSNLNPGSMNVLVDWGDGVAIQFALYELFDEKWAIGIPGDHRQSLLPLPDQDSPHQLCAQEEKHAV